MANHDKYAPQWFMTRKQKEELKAQQPKEIAPEDILYQISLPNGVTFTKLKPGNALTETKYDQYGFWLFD